METTGTPRQSVGFPGARWGVAQSRFHVDLKSNFALKNNSMEFLPGVFAWSDYSADKCNVRITDEIDMTTLQVSCWRVKFLWQPQSHIYTKWSSRRYGLGCHAPIFLNFAWSHLQKFGYTNAIAPESANIQVQVTGCAVLSKIIKTNKICGFPSKTHVFTYLKTRFNVLGESM